MAFTTSGQETEWALFLQPRSPHGAGGHESLRASYVLLYCAKNQLMMWTYAWLQRMVYSSILGDTLVASTSCTGAWRSGYHLSLS